MMLDRPFNAPPRKASRMLTKKEALAGFREHILPGIKAEFEKDGRVDSVARCEAWCNWTDALHKDGQITRHQCDNWTNPF